jgi:hypothetical protein
MTLSVLPRVAVRVKVSGFEKGKREIKENTNSG